MRVYTVVVVVVVVVAAEDFKPVDLSGNSAFQVSMPCV